MSSDFDLTRAMDLLRAREDADNTLLVILSTLLPVLAEARERATEPRLRITLRRLAERIEKAQLIPFHGSPVPSLDDVTAEDVAIYCRVNRDLLADVFAGTEAAELFAEVMDAAELAADDYADYLELETGIDDVDQARAARLVDTCPRCRVRLPRDHSGAISRTDNHTEVCGLCGSEEAVDQAADTLTPQSDWPVWRWNPDL